MLEVNKIYNMDCVEGMKLLADESVDLVVTSPPYDNLRTYNGYSFDFEATANELYRVIKQGGVVVWVIGDQTINGSESGTSFRQALYFKEIGFNLHDTMIYLKSSASFPETTRYYQVFEYMFVFSKGTPKAINLLNDKINKWGGSTSFGKSSYRQVDGTLKTGNKILVKETGLRNNVWEFSNGKGNTTRDVIAYDHPAIFPEKLAQDHIISWSNKNDIVLDPFMGSGSTAKMARLNNRNFIGFEISKEYCEIAEKRIAPYMNQINIFDLQEGEQYGT
jgi:site-specific DNA-methyltransferase (adenine-specific)